MDETSATTSEATTSQAAPAQDADEQQPVEEGGQDGVPGFRTRGRVRRRVRFLRKARELAYRDLGGLVFDLHRFGQRNDPLVLAKLGTLREIDTELRSLETALDERLSPTILREAGLTACARCAAIHSVEDNFCPNCGLPMSRHRDLPIAGPAAGAASLPAAPRAGALPVADSAATAGASPPSGAAHGAAPAAPAGDSARAPVAAPAPAAPAGERSSNGPQAPAGEGQAAGSGAEGPTEILRPPPASR